MSVQRLASPVQPSRAAQAQTYIAFENNIINMERDPLIARESEIQAHRHGSGGVDGDGGKSVLSSKANSISGDENSPLLGAGERDGGADIDDFAGLPWHRKPSVRYPLCVVSRAEN